MGGWIGICLVLIVLLFGMGYIVWSYLIKAVRIAMKEGENS